MLVFFLCRAQTMHLEHQSLKSIIPENLCRFQHVDLLGLCNIAFSDAFLMYSTIPFFTVLYQAHQQPQGSLQFSSASFSVFLVLGLSTCFSFDFLQCDVCVWRNGHINHFAGGIHWIFNDEVWFVRCYSSISIDWHVHMMVMFLSLLCIAVSGLCSYNLSVIPISWSLQMLE